MESRGYSLAVARGLLIAVASLVWRMCSGARALQWLRHTGIFALQYVESSWIGIEPMSPALAGGVLTTGLPEKFP